MPAIFIHQNTRYCINIKYFDIHIYKLRTEAASRDSCCVCYRDLPGILLSAETSKMPGNSGKEARGRE